MEGRLIKNGWLVGTTSCNIINSKIREVCIAKIELEGLMFLFVKISLILMVARITIICQLGNVQISTLF